MINELLPLAKGTGTGGDEKRMICGGGGVGNRPACCSWLALPAFGRPGCMISPISNAS